MERELGARVLGEVAGQRRGHAEGGGDMGESLLGGDLDGAVFSILIPVGKPAAHEGALGERPPRDGRRVPDEVGPLRRARGVLTPETVQGDVVSERRQIAGPTRARSWAKVVLPCLPGGIKSLLCGF